MSITGSFVLTVYVCTSESCHLHTAVYPCVYVCVCVATTGPAFHALLNELYCSLLPIDTGRLALARPLQWREKGVLREPSLGKTTLWQASFLGRSVTSLPSCRPWLRSANVNQHQPTGFVLLNTHTHQWLLHLLQFEAIKFLLLALLRGACPSVLDGGCHPFMCVAASAGIRRL